MLRWFIRSNFESFINNGKSNFRLFTGISDADFGTNEISGFESLAVQSTMKTGYQSEVYYRTTQPRQKLDTIIQDSSVLHLV